jgi:hypothetical protein
MAALVPGIHVLLSFLRDRDVDGRDKPGHNGWNEDALHSIFLASSGSMIGMPSRIG